MLRLGRFGSPNRLTIEVVVVLLTLEPMVARNNDFAAGVRFTVLSCKDAETDNRWELELELELEGGWMRWISWRRFSFVRVTSLCAICSRISSDGVGGGGGGGVDMVLLFVWIAKGVDATSPHVMIGSSKSSCSLVVPGIRTPGRMTGVRFTNV